MAIYVKSTTGTGDGTSGSPYTLDQFRTTYASGTSEDVIITSGAITAINLNYVNALTSGTINTSSVTTITGSLTDLLTTYTSDGFSNLGNEAVTLSGTTASAANLNSLNTRTGGTINVTGIAEITGSLRKLWATSSQGGHQALICL
jgi:hypothetical protein